MREILFRGKRIENGEWVYGSLVLWYDGSISIETGVYDAPMYAVDPATIGQFTGLTDKNGKRIFEGDILRQKKNGVYGFPFSVVFDDGGFMWNENGRRDFLYQSICDTCEVIGNIHDNYEFLEGE